MKLWMTMVTVMMMLLFEVDEDDPEDHDHQSEDPDNHDYETDTHKYVQVRSASAMQISLFRIPERREHNTTGLVLEGMLGSLVNWQFPTSSFYSHTRLCAEWKQPYGEGWDAAECCSSL